MKFLQRAWSGCILLILCISYLILSAAATSNFMEHEGLEITVQMDKEQYEDYEPITATIVVENKSTEIVTIDNLEQLIPAGYVLSNNSQVSTENVELLPQEIVVLQVTYEQESADDAVAAQEDFFDKLLFGETWGLPNVLLIVLLAIAVTIFMILT